MSRLGCHLRPLLLAGALLAAAACTTEQQSTPGPTLTTTSPSTTAVTTTTTTAAPTTTEAAPTTESTTTAPPAPSGPTEALVPLLIGGGGGGGWLFLGAWQQGAWQRAFDPNGNPIQPGIEAGTAFTVSNLDGETPAVLGDNVEACPDGRVGPTIDVSVAPVDPDGIGYAAVAVLTQPWPLTPRPVATISSAPEAYRALAAAAFDDSVDTSQGNIEQLVIADLDGDGDDEALAAFEFIQPTSGPGTPGDLAAMVLIDVDTRAASTVLSTVVADSATPEAPGLRRRFRVLNVADLNGDGRMEVLVNSSYYEGASVIVYTYDGTALTEVLDSGCGS